MSYRLQFAVVREDPIIPFTVIQDLSPRKVLMIASGGCVALSLKTLFPSVSFTLFDLNPIQIDHVKLKISSLKNYDKERFNQTFNIGVDDKHELNACGAFESLFRSFRNFLFEFVCSRERMQIMFTTRNLDKSDLIKKSIFDSKYWSVAFELFFSDRLLVAMFGDEAVQHAESGSYPMYFKKQLEMGLCRSDFYDNYFLHHIFLGYYLNIDNCLPEYLKGKYTLMERELDFNFLNMNLLEIRNIEDFHIIDLSNIFDWMRRKDIMKHLSYLEDNLESGSVIIYRQLNNKAEHLSNFKKLQRDDILSDKLLELDKSLFYERINIIRRV